MGFTETDSNGGTSSFAETYTLRRESHLKSLQVSIHKSRDEDPVLAKNSDPGLCTSNKEIFLKISKANILDNFKSYLCVSILLVPDVQ